MQKEKVFSSVFRSFQGGIFITLSLSTGNGSMSLGTVLILLSDVGFIMWNVRIYL